VAASCLDCRSCLNVRPDVDGRIYCAKLRAHLYPVVAEGCRHMRPREEVRKGKR